MGGMVLFLCLFVTGCLGDGEPHIAFNDAAKDLGDGWSVATPEEAGMSSEGLKRAYQDWWDSDDFRQACSLIVIRHGKLIKEGYARNLVDRTRRTAIWSATKSITSLDLGIARGLGYLQDLDQPIYEIIPEAFKGVEVEKRAITLRHLLTMTSGLDFKDDGIHSVSVELSPHADATKHPITYILKKPMYAKPGETFYYQSANPHLIGAIIQKVTGKTLEQLAVEYLFTPLGIQDFNWESDTEGHSFGGFGLFMRPRDMGKIGQLVLQGGVCNETTIIPKEWLSQSTIPQSPVPEDDPEWEGAKYGYYWWIFPDLGEGAIAASGHGGQFIFILPQYDLVIVETANPNPDYSGDGGIDWNRFKRIIKAIIKSIDSDSV
jgi:CubicO group peptidase (beta-lactamase class C family)